MNFDVFLSHNSVDKAAVEAIAHKLKDAGVEPWLDKWYLVPRKNLSIDPRLSAPALQRLIQAMHKVAASHSRAVLRWIELPLDFRATYHRNFNRRIA